MVKCECEHRAHFDKRERTPNGNPTHKYATQYHESYMRKKKTEWGTFNVCKDCSKDCYQMYHTIGA
jgi:hypothetical protein